MYSLQNSIVIANMFNKRCWYVWFVEEKEFRDIVQIFPHFLRFRAVAQIVLHQLPGVYLPAQGIVDVAGIIDVLKSVQSGKSSLYIDFN